LKLFQAIPVKGRRKIDRNRGRHQAEGLDLTQPILKPKIPGTKMMLQSQPDGGTHAKLRLTRPARGVDLPEVAETRGFLLTFGAKVCRDGAPVLSGDPALLHG
jgi:hypothetical protein